MNKNLYTTEITGPELMARRALTVKFKTDRTHTMNADSLSAAAMMFRNSIDENYLGASQTGDCVISEKGKRIARVSYNGRVWEMPK